MAAEASLSRRGHSLVAAVVSGLPSSSRAIGTHDACQLTSSDGLMARTGTCHRGRLNLITHLTATLPQIACLVIHTFQLVFSAETVFFSHNKSIGTMFRLVFSAKQIGPSHSLIHLAYMCMDQEQVSVSSSTIKSKHLTSIIYCMVP